MRPRPYSSINNQLLKNIIDKVTKRQMIYTIIFIAISILVSYVFSIFVDNVFLNITFSILLMAVSIPKAANIAEKISFDKKMDYSGYWLYEADFQVVLNPDTRAIDEKDRKLVEDRFHNKTEKGIVSFVLDGIDLRITEAKGLVEDKTHVKWESDPAIFDSSSIRWTFIGGINWDLFNKDHQSFADSDFNGIEYYEVHDRNPTTGQPSLLKGYLLGCIQLSRQFSIIGEVSYTRIEQEEYNSMLSKLNNALKHTSSDLSVSNP